MKKVILRTPERTKSNSFSDAIFSDVYFHIFLKQLVYEC
jgi:hypothetical protein